jgi:hypothetical protein
VRHYQGEVIDKETNDVMIQSFDLYEDGTVVSAIFDKRTNALICTEQFTAQLEIKDIADGLTFSTLTNAYNKVN